MTSLGTPESFGQALDRVKTPGGDTPQDIFRGVIEKTGRDSELGKTLTLFEGPILEGLSGEKRQTLQDFLSDPQVFVNNRSLYRNLFLLMKIDLDNSKLEELHNISPSILTQYKLYQIKRNSEHKSSEVQSTAEKDQSAAMKKLNTKEERLINQKRFEALKSHTDVAKSTLSPEWKRKLDTYVEGNVKNDAKFEQLKSEKTDLKLENEEDKRLYLEAEFLLLNEKSIKSEFEKQFTQASTPEQKKEVESRLENFTSSIDEIRRLNIVSELIPANALSKSLAGNFPPTPATETAIAQAEKYEKTHTVYRDGTSLYFVNKDNPKDVKKIEIFADRAVLTISQSGLSISRDMDLLSRDDAEKRREKRRLDESGNQLERIVATDRARIAFLQDQDVPATLKQNTEFSNYNQARKNFDEAKDDKSKLDRLKELRYANNALESERRKNISIDTDEKTSQSLSSLEDKLIQELDGINKLEISLLRLVENKERLAGLKNKGGENGIDYKSFEQIAKSNLAFLDDMGYDTLGQSTLEQVVNSLNREYQGIAGAPYIDISRNPLDNQQKQRLLLAITSLIRTAGKGIMPEWENVDTTDELIAYRQTRSPLWNTSLQSLAKKPDYQRLIQNPDTSRLQSIITGREKPKSASEAT